MRRPSVARGATTGSPTSVFQVATGGKIGGRGAGRDPEQPDAESASRSRDAARRDKSRTIQRRAWTTAAARGRGAARAGGIIAAPHASMQRDTILILDFGSQFTQLIARRLRELSVYSEILPPSTRAEALQARAPRGIVLSG